MNVIIENITAYLQQVLAFVMNFSTDVTIIVGIFLILVFIAFQFGKARTIALILGMYVTLLLYLNFPYGSLLNFINDTPLSVVGSGVLLFVVLLFIVYAVIGRAIEANFSSDFLHAWFEALLLSLVGTALVVAFVYHALPSIISVHDFAPEIDRFFESPELFFWWLAAPIIVLFFVLPRRIT